LIAEFRRLWTLARDGWKKGARPWLAVALTLSAALVPALLHFHVLSPELWKSGDVYASLPLATELARLPMSIFLPTPYLPVWGACLQLFVVIGLGELILGRRLTIAVAIFGHFGATLVARVLLDGVHTYLFGLSPALAHLLDTGPSAATTAVGACLLVCSRMTRSAILLSVGLVAAALLAPGVDGVEHLVALACGLLAGATYRVFSSTSFHVPSLPLMWSRRPLWMRRAARLPRLALQVLRGRGVSSARSR
jgi:hypothetical protein